MAEFGKLNFAVAFAPQTAFPLDARYYFTSLAAAEAAAASSVEVGSSTGTYFYGENVVVVTETSATLYLIQPDKTLKEVGSIPVGDGKSIEIVDGQVAIKGFESAENGAQLTKGADGSLQWVKPDTTTVESNRVAIETLTGNVYTKTETEAKIAEAGHASFKKVDAVPTVEIAESNVLYLVMNADTGFYDIYAKVDNAVVRLDDVSVNLEDYSTTEETNAAITEAIKNKVDAVEGSRLMTNEEGAKLETVKENAEPNFIKSVDTANFSVDTNGKLGLVAVTESQVTGLTDVLAAKASAEELTAVDGRLTTVETKVSTLEANLGTLQTNVSNNTQSIENLQAVAGALDTTYVKLTDYNSQVGTYANLVHYAGETSTVIDEINNLNERLVWNELSE